MENGADIVAAILKRPEDATHHGVKGQRWGFRRTRAELDSSPDAQKAADAKAKIKSSGGTHSLSNQELQHLVNRMNLEQQFSRLSSQKSTKNAGAKFVQDMLVNIGKQQITKIANDTITKQVGAALKK